MPKKKLHRISNWREYNKALVNRGSLTIWFDKDTIKSWFNGRLLKKRGRPVLYSDLAIEFCLTIKALYKLPLRATQGFAQSIFKMMRLSLQNESTGNAKICNLLIFDYRIALACKKFDLFNNALPQ